MGRRPRSVSSPTLREETTEKKFSGPGHSQRGSSMASKFGSKIVDRMMGASGGRNTYNPRRDLRSSVSHTQGTKGQAERGIAWSHYDDAMRKAEGLPADAKEKKQAEARATFKQATPHFQASGSVGGADAPAGTPAVKKYEASEIGQERKSEFRDTAVFEQASVERSRLRRATSSASLMSPRGLFGNTRGSSSAQGREAFVQGLDKEESDEFSARVDHAKQELDGLPYARKMDIARLAESANRGAERSKAALALTPVPEGGVITKALVTASRGATSLAWHRVREEAHRLATTEPDEDRASLHSAFAELGAAKGREKKNQALGSFVEAAAGGLEYEHRPPSPSSPKEKGAKWATQPLAGSVRSSVNSGVAAQATAGARAASSGPSGLSKAQAKAKVGKALSALYKRNKLKNK